MKAVVPGVSAIIVDNVRKIEKIDLIIYNNKQPVYHFIIINYLAYPVGGKLKAGSDASDAKWMSIKEIKDLINKNMAPKILKIPLRKLNLI
ncbi:hypothetical protein B6U96_04720 [Archaeoglobales archaeon ex4484_92]|nr:MAG: hypothetical protein B6U96_04720 [Archaeoglobales archaeon ex4484_92]